MFFNEFCVYCHSCGNDVPLDEITIYSVKDYFYLRCPFCSCEIDVEDKNG